MRPLFELERRMRGGDPNRSHSMAKEGSSERPWGRSERELGCKINSQKKKVQREGPDAYPVPGGVIPRAGAHSLGWGGCNGSQPTTLIDDVEDGFEPGEDAMLELVGGAETLDGAKGSKECFLAGWISVKVRSTVALRRVVVL
jgi:hypothetical protein